MSRFKKICLASTLVIVGFGVAKFLGQPVLSPLPLNTQSVQALLAPVALPNRTAESNGPQVPGRVRLLPDSPAPYADTAAATAAPESPRPGNTLAPVFANSNRADSSPLSPADGAVPISSAFSSNGTSPRAALRNEAPRPVGIDPQSPAAIRRLPSGNGDAVDPYKVAGSSTGGTNWSAPQLLNTGYADAGQSPPPAMVASYTAPASPVTNSSAAPPPWPMPEEAVEPRTHIVADGDSLERLASRYLSDPQRGREIYELNRAVLSSPDLLPIGAELKIPDRVVSTGWDRRGFQPNSASAGPNRDIGLEKPTPIQPASASQGIVPRAQLAPPVMVQ